MFNNSNWNFTLVFALLKDLYSFSLNGIDTQNPIKGSRIKKSGYIHWCSNNKLLYSQ
jgi:hypothetical protein